MPDELPRPASAHDFEVILTGVYYCDMVFTGLPQMPALGCEIFGTGFDILPGGTFNTAIAMHRLGINVGWRCDFGNDFFSQFVLDAAHEAGLDNRLFVMHDQPLRNLTVSLSFTDDRAFVTFADAPRPARVVDLMNHYTTRCVMLPVLEYEKDILTLGERVRSQGGFLYMDCAQTEATLATPGVAEALKAVDIFAPNATEALQLTNAATIEEALATLAELVPLVIIKSGSGGAIAKQGDRVLRSPGLKVEVVDTTGAGDCFNAGFLYGYLRGDPLEQCLQMGNIVGGLSTTSRGTLHAPTRAELEQHLLQSLKEN